MDFAPPKTAPQHRDRCDTEIELTRWAAADEANDMGLRRLVVYTCFDQVRLPRDERARARAESASLRAQFALLPF